jgi:hypothetical protein
MKNLLGYASGMFLSLAALSLGCNDSQFEKKMSESLSRPYEETRSLQESKSIKQPGQSQKPSEKFYDDLESKAHTLAIKLALSDPNNFHKAYFTSNNNNVHGYFSNNIISSENKEGKPTRVSLKDPNTPSLAILLIGTGSERTDYICNIKPSQEPNSLFAMTPLDAHFSYSFKDSLLETISMNTLGAIIEYSKIAESNNISVWRRVCSVQDKAAVYSAKPYKAYSRIVPVRDMQKYLDLAVVIEKKFPYFPPSDMKSSK